MRAPKPALDLMTDFPRFVLDQAKRQGHPRRPPATSANWEQRLADVRGALDRSFGRRLLADCPLEPEVLGIVERPGYLIERLTFQSQPGLRVTANLYRPTNHDAPLPGVLCVHGHWPLGRIDPDVQPYCIGLARLGFIALCVDAFGAGERSIEPEQGGYHGGLIGASLWPLGTSLMGLQVHDNRRAVDYLISRPEVDSNRLAITGASGGGNQSLYAGATDERLRAVVPVCGIGTYESYLTTACCICEVNIGGVKQASTGDILALIAPRSLLVISASQDSFQFSPGEAAKSVSYAAERYRLLGHPDRIRQVTFDAGHGYHQPMREAMYGWLTLALKDEGKGEPIPEPPLQIEDSQTLRCFADGSSRPRSIVTIPQFAHDLGRRRLETLEAVPDHAERWTADSIRMKAQLRDQVLGGFPPFEDLSPRVEKAEQAGRYRISIAPERGIRLVGDFWFARGQAATDRQSSGAVAVIAPTWTTWEEAEKLSAPWREKGQAVACLGLRASGMAKPQTPSIAGTADHNEAEWSAWLGRPLLGQWVQDVLGWLETIQLLTNQADRYGLPRSFQPPITVAGHGIGGLVALAAASQSDKINRVEVRDCLVSLVSPDESPWHGQPLAAAVPGMLAVVDIPQLAALVAPRPLLFENGIFANGRRPSANELRGSLKFTREIYALLGVGKALEIKAEGNS